jgi:hypothetical protein
MSFGDKCVPKLELGNEGGMHPATGSRSPWAALDIAWRRRRRVAQRSGYNSKTERSRPRKVVW